MGGKDTGDGRMDEEATLEDENGKLKMMVSNLEASLQQSESNKLQVQTSYEEALQTLADSEAKRETIDKELKLAHEQIASMWKELESLRKQLDGPSLSDVPFANSETAFVNDSHLELHCTLCKEKINPKQASHDGSPSLSKRGKQTSPESSPKTSRSRMGSWLSFGRKQTRVQDTESHSKSCSTNTRQEGTTQNSTHKITKSSNPPPTNRSPFFRISSRSASPFKQIFSQSVDDFLLVNVTRSPPGITGLSPFKIVTKTNMAHLPQPAMEVHRSQGDFQWFFEALQEASPERIVPPLKPPISLDATMSEFQRFLTRVSAHKLLRKHHLFIVFLMGTAEELRSSKAKFRPHCHGDQVKYKPAVGRDTNTGPLVTTKDYLATLEQNIFGLVNHLEQTTKKMSSTLKIGHWFKAISDAEPEKFGTYLKTAASDLSRTCEAIEGHHSDSDDGLLIQNLHSIAEYVQAANGLLTRVEEAVDKFLYWDEEVTILEAVTSSPVFETPPPAIGTESGNEQDIIFDDSGVSDVTTSSNNSNNSSHAAGHMTAHSSSSLNESISTSEKWAQASKYCADSKDYLEMMCHDLAEELSHFDLQKEKELKQVLVDYASSQQERHEKCQGKWFAMKLLLDTPILPEQRAIHFTNSVGDTSDPTSSKK